MSTTSTPPDPIKTAQAGAAIVSGAGGAAREWALLAGRRYESGLRGLVALAACRTPGDLIAAQAAMVCEDIELLASSGARIAELVAATAGGAVRSLDG
ncbi:MAG TPA: phasin family protein [Caulobacteraceae bacterium]